MEYKLSFQDIKVGDVVVFEKSWGDKEHAGRGVVTRVSPTRFKFTYDATKVSENRKTDGARYGYSGHEVLYLDTPESKAEYDALQEKEKADRTESYRKHETAQRMNAQALSAGLGGLTVYGYGYFDMKIRADEKQAQAIIDALIEAGIKL